MRTIKLTLAIAAVTLSTTICQAQPGGEGRPNNNRGMAQDGQRPERHDKGAKMTEQLGLSKEQAQKMKAIHQKQRAEHEGIQEKMDILKKQLQTLKTQKKALNDIKMKEIEGLLTPEQFIKFKELKEKRKENKKGKK